MAKQAIKYVDWGHFIQMDKSQWKRLVRWMGELGVTVDEDRRPVLPAKTERGILRQTKLPRSPTPR